MESVETQDAPVKPPPSKAEKLYNGLLNDGYSEKVLGTKDEFINNLQNPIKANKLYSGLRADGYGEDVLGDMVSFRNNLLLPKKAGGAGSPPTSNPSQSGGETVPGFRTPDLKKPVSIDNSNSNMRSGTWDTPQQQGNPVVKTKPRLITKEEDKTFDKPVSMSKMTVQGNSRKANSWENIGDFVPNAVLGGLEKDASDLVKYMMKDPKKHPEYTPQNNWLLDLSQKLETGANDKLNKADEHQLPNTTMGDVTTTATRFGPDLLELAMTPEMELGKFGEIVGKYGGKYATKGAEALTGKFPTLMAAKGLTSGYAEALKDGKTEDEANSEGLKKMVKEYGNGVLMEVGGKAANNVTKLGIGALEDAGWMADGKILNTAQKAIMHSSAQAAAFSIIPFVSNALDGKGTTLDEVKKNAVFGGILGALGGGGEEPTDADKSAKEVLKRTPAIDFHNFMNADMDAIHQAHAMDATPIDLELKSAQQADKAFKSDDPEEKQSATVQSGIIGKLASVKSVTEAILKDKNGVIDGINQLPISDETKSAMVDKVNQVHKELDPAEQVKTQLSAKIGELDEAIANNQQRSDSDPIESADKKVVDERLNKEKNALTGELEKTISNQYEQEIKDNSEEAKLQDEIKPVEKKTDGGAENAPLQKEKDPIDLFKLGDHDEFYHASPTKRVGDLKEGEAPQFGKGIYFSTNKDLVINEFGKELTKVNLSIKNPLYTGSPEEIKVRDLAAKNWNKENLTYDTENELYVNKNGKETEPVTGDDLGERLPVKYFSNAAKELGHDAIIDKGSETYDNEIVVLDPKKIHYKDEEPRDVQQPENDKSTSRTQNTGSEPDETGGKEVKKTILTKRAYEGDIQDEVKRHLEEKGLTRKSFSQEERSGQATDFINKFGDEATVKAIKKGDIDGGLASSALAQLQIKNSQTMSELSPESEEYKKLAKKNSDLIELSEKKGYLSGEFVGQLAYEYQNSELNYASIKRQVEKSTGKSLSPEQDKKIKELSKQNEHLKSQLTHAEAKLIDETDKAFSAGRESVKNESKADKAKRIADKIRQGKLSRPGIFSSATPASLVWDGAVEVVAKSIEAGGKLADAINDGLEHIKKSDWYKGLSENKKQKAEDEFKSAHQETAGSNSLEDLQERFLGKTDNKFTPGQARDLWSYIKENYIKQGVNYRDAIAKTADDLGLSWRQVSEAIVTPKTKRIADEMWKKQYDFNRYRIGAKNWIEDQNKSPFVRTLKGISGAFRGVAVFGHGGIFVGTHAGMNLFNPSTWSKTIPAFLNGWKFAYGSEANFQRAMEELKSSPNYVIAQRAGLKNDPDRINAEEYQKSQKYLEKLAPLGKIGKVIAGGAEAGEKGFNAIKVLRQGLFDYHYNKLDAAEKQDPNTAKSIAKIVNLATGATNLNIPEWVNEVSFAGGMEASRWEKLTSNPIKATKTAIKAITNPSQVTTEEKVFAKVWARRVGEQLATYSAALVANAALQHCINPKNPVNLTDPSKPDFLEFKFGDLAVDPTSGMRGTAQFIYQIGKIPFEAPKNGEDRVKTLSKKVGQRIKGKLAPFYSTAAEVYSGRDFSGNVVPWSDEKPPSYGTNLTWGQYAWSKSPLPVAEAADVFYKSALEHGADKNTLNDVIKAVMSGGISGTTGFRVMDSESMSSSIDKKLQTIKNDDGEKVQLPKEQFELRKTIFDKSLSSNPKDWQDKDENRKAWTDDFEDFWNNDANAKKIATETNRLKAIGANKSRIDNAISSMKSEALQEFLQDKAIKYSADKLDELNESKPFSILKK